MVIVAVYAPPSASISALEKQLNNIRNEIAPLMEREVLVLGDFNAKSTLWGSPRTNPRGEAVMDWAAELDLQLINKGRQSTCVRWQGESIVNLTWASPSAARKIRSWKVLVETETLSDHRYIVITMRPLPGEGGRNNTRAEADRERRQEKTSYPRWALKKLDPERLRTAANAEAWDTPSQELTTTDVDKQAEQIQKQMTNICDAAMPRVRQARKNATYWWSPEIERKRRACVLARRKLQHFKRKKTLTRSEEEQARLRYRGAIVELQLAIKEAKAKA